MAALDALDLGSGSASGAAAGGRAAWKGRRRPGKAAAVVHKEGDSEDVFYRSGADYAEASSCFASRPQEPAPSSVHSAAVARLAGDLQEMRTQVEGYVGPLPLHIQNLRALLAASNGTKHQYEVDGAAQEVLRGIAPWQDLPVQVQGHGGPRSRGSSTSGRRGLVVNQA